MKRLDKSGPNKRQGNLADVENKNKQEAHSTPSPATMLACDSMINLLGQLARKVAISNTSNAALEQKLATPLQAIPSPYACTEKTAYQSLFLSIQVRLKAAVGHPNYNMWRQFYTFHISQKVISIE